MVRFGRSYPAQRIWTPRQPAVLYNAVGTGASELGVSTALTWTHNAAAGAYVLVFLTTNGAHTFSAPTYGSTAMTLLATGLQNNNSSNGYLFAYGVAGVASGSTTITATPSSAGTFLGNSVSYTNVVSVGTASTNYGSSTSPSQTLSCSAGQMIVQAFGGEAGQFTASSGGTQRYSGYATSGSNYVPLVIQDSKVSVTFGATLSPSDPWAGVGIVLN